MSMQHNAKAGSEDWSNWHVARLKKGGTHVEIVINADEAMAFRAGKGPLEDALVYPRVFTDAKKGLEASPDDLEKSCGTTDVMTAIEYILKNGEVQLSASYRAKKREEKYKQIVNWIHQNAINPTTAKKLPHPLERIELALEEAKVRIDEAKSAEQQVDAIVDKLKPILPIVVMKKRLHVVIPAVHAAKSYHLLHSFGKVLKESYGSDGSWIGEIEIPGGMEPDFYDKLNSATHGDNQVTVIE